MSYEEMRQLVRIRHELRRLEPEQDRDAAARLLSLMRSLSARDERELATVEPELQRWQVAFSLAE
jgi:hypothetical protein